MRAAWDVYQCVFFMLENACEQMACPRDALSEFLSDANPFLWADRGSQDPTNWMEFERAYSSRFPAGEGTDEGSLAFARAYLGRQGAYYASVFPDGDATPFLELFDRETDPAEWTRMLDDVGRQGRSRFGEHETRLTWEPERKSGSNTKYGAASGLTPLPPTEDTP